MDVVVRDSRRGKQDRIIEWDMRGRDSTMKWGGWDREDGMVEWNK